MPDRDDAVRRLLAEARHDEPLPPEVAARLDTLLGDLVQARSAETRVTSLAARRGRRRGLFLAAAVAAVVVAVVGPRVAESSLDGSASDSTASESTASDSGGSDSGGSRSSAQAPEQAQDEASALAAPRAADGGVVVLTEAGFDSEVALAARRGPQPFASDLSLTGIACGPAAYGAGRLRPALYDGTPAVLALRPAAGGVRRVDLLACGSAEVLRTTTVTSR